MNTTGIKIIKKISTIVSATIRSVTAHITNSIVVNQTWQFQKINSGNLKINDSNMIGQTTKDIFNVPYHKLQA